MLYYYLVTAITLEANTSLLNSGKHVSLSFTATKFLPKISLTCTPLSLPSISSLPDLSLVKFPRSPSRCLSVIPGQPWSPFPKINLEYTMSSLGVVNVIYTPCSVPTDSPEIDPLIFT